MNRRHFLKKSYLANSVVTAIPFLSFGKMNFLSNGKLKFVTASDGHFGQPETDFEGSHRMLIDAISKEGDLDFVVFNGDLIHDDPKWMPKVKKYYDGLNVPYFPVRGNHDRVSVSDWEEIWGISTDFAFRHKEDFGIILADSSNQAGEYHCVNVDFLSSKLKEFNDLSQVFIFIHISQNDWTRHGISCQEILDLIGSYPNVKAVFHGHDHDVDGIMLRNKKPYLWSGHFGGSWGSPIPSYRVCEVSEEGKIVTYVKSIKDGMILSSHTL